MASNIQNFALENLTIVAGTTVTWTNRDSVIHTSTAGVPDSPRADQWDSPFLRQNQEFSFTFEDVGVFQYFCRVHPSSMRGTVTVVEAAGSSQESKTPGLDKDGYGGR